MAESCWKARDPGGTSLAEVLVTLTIAATVGGLGAAWLGHARTRFVGELAARHLASVFRGARLDAARRGAAVGVELVPGDGCSGYREVADGDDDGVRAADLGSGIDVPVQPMRCLSWDFPGVRFGIPSSLPDIGGAGPLVPGDDPLRLGQDDILRFSPAGTASGGTVYLAGPDGSAYAVRVLGVTGRVRMLSYNPVGAQWEER